MEVQWQILDYHTRYANLPNDHQLICKFSGKSWFVWLNSTYPLAGDANEFTAKRLACEDGWVEKWIQKFEEVFGTGGRFAKERTMATATVNKGGKAQTQPATQETNGGEEEPKKKTPPKDPKSLTAEELDAAIDGNLEPRKVKGTADQLGLSGEVGARGPTGRPIGILTGLPIQGAWLYLFGENNRAPEKPAKVDSKTGLAIPGSGKMTDEQLSAHMKADFPNRVNKTFDGVPGVRRNQQNGQATGGKPLNYTSVAYDKDANVVTGRTKKEKAGEEGEGEEGEETKAPATPAKKK